MLYHLDKDYHLVYNIYIFDHSSSLNPKKKGATVTSVPKLGTNHRGQIYISLIHVQVLDAVSIRVHLQSPMESLYSAIHLQHLNTYI